MTNAVPDAALARRVSLRQPYAPRVVRCLEIWQENGWILKVYGIAWRDAGPRPEVVDQAKRTAAFALPTPAEADARYGIGFLIVHDGQDARWLLVDWWEQESILHHQLFTAPLDGSGPFEPVSTGLTACVWELPVILFERDAWVNTVLREPGQPMVASYLAWQLNTKV